MHTATLSAAILIITSVVADDIVSLFVPVLDDEPIVGKLLGTRGQMTSYALNCPTSVPAESCYFPEEGYTMAQGPSSFEWTYSYSGFQASQDCTFLSTTGVRCTATMVEDGQTVVSKAQFTTDSITFHPVTITATETQDGASTTAAAATTGGSPSMTSATATATTAPMDGNKTSGATTAVSAAHATSDNAAMACATGSPVWIAGAAMGMALAMV
ncbi:hypothetical protein BDV59DRAFT_189120 [Aspergillus ambiguus]|uniref:putative GPI anchored glycoprotein n=1 Tax=Aspergillus ambiguus TaxID=176160 RepID=UPI003CCD1E8C